MQINSSLSSIIGYIYIISIMRIRLINLISAANENFAIRVTYISKAEEHCGEFFLFKASYTRIQLLLKVIVVARMSFNNTENVLQVINTDYVTLNSTVIANNNRILKETLTVMIKIMQDKDPLFAKLYEETFYGGSYFDDLKVGKPDEFDLDLLLVLPKACEIHKTKTCPCIVVQPSNKPGFFWFKVAKGYFSAFDKFIKDGYVQTNLVLNWLQSLVTRTLNAMNNVDFNITTPKFNSQSGPALTLQLFGDFGVMDVDLVPAFKFGSKYWPEVAYRANPSSKKMDFFIVPKMARGIDKGERYWRASFQSQERELINGKQRLKPALRLLKKLRNSLGHDQICSYALKTIVLWEVDSFDWNRSLSSVFLDLLEKYRDSLQAKKIQYYWNKNGNLLDGIRSDTLANHCNEITRKINKFKKNQDTNPLEIAKIILRENSEEYEQFMRRCSEEGMRELSYLYLLISNNIYFLELQGEPSFFPSRSNAPDQSSSPFQTTQQKDNNAGLWIAGAVAVAALVGIIFGTTRPSNSNRN